jgi:hemoglobin-like flavoprotein
MATILFFNQSEQELINPTLPLVAELGRRVERVIYYSLEDFKPALDPAFAQPSASMGESLCQAGGYMCAADEIQPFMYNQLAKHLGKNEPVRWNEIR